MRPRIHEKEFEIRQKKVQKMMAEKEIDLVLAYADDRFVYGQAYARWLVNYQPAFEAAFVMVPAEGNVAVATGAESLEFVHGFSYCKEVYAVWEFLHPDEEYPYCEIVSMKDVKASMEEKMGRVIKKVGIAGTSAVPYEMMLKLQELFGAENIVDVDEDMTMLRAVKTENELEVIRYAYEIAEAGMKRCAEVLREGITEREVAAEAEYVMRKMGSEGMGIDTMVAAGKEHTMPILARLTDRPIQKGDLVVITLAPRYEGYHGAIARPFFIGEPDQKLWEIFELEQRAQRETREMLRPGVCAKDVDRVSRQAINEAGLGDHFVYTGVHSCGAIEFEAPILASKCEVVLEENMVFSIDIPLFINEWGGMRLENGYIITKDGAEPLNSHDMSYCVIKCD